MNQLKRDSKNTLKDYNLYNEQINPHFAHVPENYRHYETDAQNIYQQRDEERPSNASMNSKYHPDRSRKSEKGMYMMPNPRTHSKSISESKNLQQSSNGPTRTITTISTVPEVSVGSAMPARGFTSMPSTKNTLCKLFPKNFAKTFLERSSKRILISGAKWKRWTTAHSSLRSHKWPERWRTSRKLLSVLKF